MRITHLVMWKELVLKLDFTGWLEYHRRGPILSLVIILTVAFDQFGEIAMKPVRLRGTAHLMGPMMAPC